MTEFRRVLFRSQKIAYTVTTELHEQSDFYIDLHGGDLHEALEPFVTYSEEGSQEVTRISKEAASLMGIKYIRGSSSINGSFSSAASKGIPGFLVEIGQCGLWREEEVKQFITGVKNVLKYLKVLDGKSEPLCKVEYIHRLNGLKAKQTGCWYSSVIPGQKVDQNEKVGEIKDYFRESLGEYFSPVKGVVIYTASSLAINVGDPIIAVGGREER